MNGPRLLQKGPGVNKEIDSDQCKDPSKHGKPTGCGTLNLPLGEEEKEYVKTFLYPDGSIYKGRCKKGQKQGYGSLSSPDGKEYKGNWNQDEKSGYGTMNYPDGSYFEGLWEDGIQHGPGIWTESNGTQIKGTWIEGKLNGKITVIYPCGSSFSGYYEIKDSKNKSLLDCVEQQLEKGFARVKYSDGRKYLGYAKLSISNERGTVRSSLFTPDGRGIMTYPDDTVAYEGISHAKGKYDGYWVDGKKDGYGRFSSPLFGEYEGSWSKGCITGYGKMTWPNKIQVSTNIMIIYM